MDDFKKAFPNQDDVPENYNAQELNKSAFLFRHLHNPSGPAIIRYNAPTPIAEYKGVLLTKDGNRYEYWIDGKLLNVENKDAATKMHHGTLFTKKLHEMVE